MGKKLTLLFFIFLSILLASENNVNYIKKSGTIISKTLSDNIQVFVDQNFLFSSEKNISIRIKDENNEVEGKNFKIHKSIKLVDIEKSNASDYYLIGYKKYDNVEYDITLIKYNPTTGAEWIKIYPQEGIEIPNKVIVNNDNSIFIGGYCAFDKESYYTIMTNDIHLMKINMEGTRVWVKTIGLKDVNEEFLDFQITSDHEILLLGKRKYFKDILYMAKINKFGNISWQNTYEVGNYIKEADFTYISQKSAIEVSANILDVEYKSKNISNKELTLHFNADGEKINSRNSIVKNLTIDNEIHENSNEYSLDMKGKGVIKSNSVNIRQKPLLNAAIITNLSKGDIVQIIEKTDDKHKINNMNDYWYHLKINEGKTGWIYGYFLDVVK